VEQELAIAPDLQRACGNAEQAVAETDIASQPDRLCSSEPCRNCARIWAGAAEAASRAISRTDGCSAARVLATLQYAPRLTSAGLNTRATPSSTSCDIFQFSG
jgi:hypothetical protein